MIRPGDNRFDEGGPVIDLEMRFEYPDKSVAEAVVAAVGPENGGYVRVTVEGSTIIFVISGEQAASVRNTADDLLACVKTAEASLGISIPAGSEDE